jgi:hypothetical protein
MKTQRHLHGFTAVCRGIHDEPRGREVLGQHLPAIAVVINDEHRTCAESVVTVRDPCRRQRCAPRDSTGSRSRDPAGPDEAGVEGVGPLGPRKKRVVVSRSRCLTTVRISLAILEHLFRSGQQTQAQQGSAACRSTPSSARPLCCSEQQSRCLATLVGACELVSRSLAGIRVTHGVQNPERFLVSDFIAELASAATSAANANGVTLTVLPVEDGVAVEADRQVLTAVVMNLLQNAFKFTRPHTVVTLGCVFAVDLPRCSVAALA